MPTYHLAGLLLLMLLEGSSLRASIVVAYESLNDPLGVSPSEVHPGISSLDLTRGAGLELASGTSFNSRGWTGTSLSSAISEDDFLQWGWLDGPQLSLQSLTLKYDRSASGPQAMAIQLAVNGDTSFQTIFSDNEVADDSTEWHTIDLTAWTNVTSARFRLLGWNASRSTGTFDMENYQLSPNRAITVTAQDAGAAVPEPSSLLVWLAPLFALLGYRPLRSGWRPLRSGWRPLRAGWLPQG